ncbi:hypothetical protein OKW21_003158 [Catalinimonas alkaloidigena]|uniref:DUF4386 domain-containing protein n=1 Tax=Catalinimonas alkaloidigena TaxID=1075417 RepID=UPI0024072CF0|nr:DUF4386 domain-containing protein [Catalinimonas alkaloidigena]MDF9797895.1 hypothetical protein [Catalinimonas alkaloidigena]
MDVKKKIRLSGFLILLGMAAGIFSVAPAIDASAYLTEAAKNFNQVIIAALFQLILSLAYLGFAILVYPLIKRYSGSFSLGFLSFRVVAVCLSVMGIIVLLSVLTMSELLVQNGMQDTPAIALLGGVLRSMRDLINHVFMVVMLCMANVMLYFLFLRKKLLPRWISVWGICGAVLSVVASILILFKVMDIITYEYLLLNAPTGIFEIFLGIWLMVKGLDIQCGFVSQNN